MCTQFLEVKNPAPFPAFLSSADWDLCSYVEMIRSAATQFPASVYEPPPEAATNMPSLNLNLGGVNVSLGGAGSGVYRTSNEGVSLQADGIKDGVNRLLGKVRQGVDRIASQ